MGAERGVLIQHSQKPCAGPSLSGEWLERVEVDAVESPQPSTHESLHHRDWGQKVSEKPSEATVMGLINTWPCTSHKRLLNLLAKFTLRVLS